MLLAIEPIFEADCSFGFRSERSTHDAPDAVSENVKEGRTAVYERGRPVRKIVESIIFNNYIIIMYNLRFVWDIDKDSINQKKHGVSFKEAVTSFYDENGKEFYDPKHSELEEDRFLFLGISAKLRLLLTSYCYRERDATIRIISSRKATKKEASFYKGEE